jgi:Helix-turn-helix domain
MSVITSRQQISATIRAVTGEAVDANTDFTTDTTPSYERARPAPSDLFDLLESKAVWKIEALEEVLEISAKTLYKRANRGTIPSFRIGSCVRIPGKALADHLRATMKKK